MPSLKYAAIRFMFEALWASRLPALIRSLSRAKGVIFTLHRVLPEAPARFSPNAILQITPAFLEYATLRLRELGLEIVSMDEAITRIENPNATPKFAVLTFDDAYRDNLVHALPILKAHQAPFTLYVPTALVDAEGEVWWQALEDIIASQSLIETPYTGIIDVFSTATLQEKQKAYDALYWRMRRMPELDRVRLIRDLARRYGYDLKKQCRDLIMTWSDLKTFASDPLCTIGAHTVSHYELAKLDRDAAQREITHSISAIAQQLGKAPTHLSYPIGGATSAGPREFQMAREIGLRSAVTTRPGGLYHADKDRLHELPRVSLNGNFQMRRALEIYATPTIFSIAQHLRG